ncbi:CotY/CotZ family spore coat protein [Virgibacillus ihumii]|uniref:CotY/CotZ family spore coat protein n=1 Tax=Virgibacillus ihumii TaxID=2686091 RepID=UPI00157D3EE1|nr:CotY/CotZ family spore coat protein [Virgibacillus ihumii]
MNRYHHDYLEDDRSKGAHHRKKCCGHCSTGCGHNKHYENCVGDVLEAILEAQRKVQHNHCKASCEGSIDDLLGKKRRSRKNTIPIVLYCGCKPFKGTGVFSYSCHSKKKLKCIETYIFKIKDLKGECAVLELLTFKSDLNDTAGNNKCSLCSQVDHKCVDDLMKTGICIEVDLSCFCAVTCLDAVRL